MMFCVEASLNHCSPRIVGMTPLGFSVLPMTKGIVPMSESAWHAFNVSKFWNCLWRYRSWLPAAAFAKFNIHVFRVA